MPDYMFDGEGMRIDGIKGKTAAKFGFKKGDIVVKMGELEITDMKSYVLASVNLKRRFNNSCSK